MNRTALLLLACIAAQSVSAARIKRGGLDLGIDLTQETKVNGLGDLSGLITIVKEQFQEIIEESVKQVVEYIKAIIYQFKLKLLEKLGSWTIADMFRPVFDGVTDFLLVAEEKPTESYVSPAQKRPGNPNYGYYPYLWKEI